MDLALYTPELGYYERPEPAIGRRGDFYTSVSVGSVFGELLAFYFAGRLAGAAPPWRLVEAGAHDGQLARDILGWFAHYRPQLLRSLDYWIVEPSARRRQWQRDTLAVFMKDLPSNSVVSGGTGDAQTGQPSAGRIHWVESLDALPAGEGGILFCNELLDAMPAHRLGWDAAARKWFEWGVAWDGFRFQWTRRPAEAGLLACLKDLAPAGLVLEEPQRVGTPLGRGLAEVLPDGYTVEISPAAMQWWEQAARRIGPGVLLALDYGFTGNEWIRPERTRGTLRACHEHRLVDDPLAHPGEMDLTAHVNWTAIERAGCRAGLRTETLCPQGRFLTRIVEAIQAHPDEFSAWTPDRLRQLQTLIHPEHLGAAFRVLLQTANV